jgi:hypothetical protein
MSQSSIRLVRTPEIDQIMAYLKRTYILLSDAEIIKLALSLAYQKLKESEKQEMHVL